MGLIKIRRSDRRLAEDDRLRDKYLDRHRSPEELVARYEAEAKRLGLRIENKSSHWGRLSRMSTTYYRELRLGTGAQNYKPFPKARLLAHELFHARQWRWWEPTKFRTRYVFWTRWRWAIEVQAYCESVRAMISMGASDKAVDAYIEDRPRVLWENYALKGLRRDHVYRYTKAILRNAATEHRARVAA